LQNLLYVGLGGAIGSILRYAVGLWAIRLFPAASLPVGTLSVNVMGCLILGLLAGISEARDLISDEVRLLVMVGLLGGFTTFSTFGAETIALFRASQRLLPVVYVVGSATLGVGAAWIGHWVGRSV
tara:strand:+ start:69 stop:446 length:378 start_codon:yes stop_codon:yes gene_type:complete